MLGIYYILMNKIMYFENILRLNFKFVYKIFELEFVPLLT